MGSSKGLSQTLWIVMAAVVVVVVAIVLLVIFGGSAEDMRILTEFKSQCKIIGTTSCKSTNSLPPTWEITTTLEDGRETSCRHEIGDSCSAVLSQSTE